MSRRRPTMIDDPRQILDEAGVECVEVEEYEGHWARCNTGNGGLTRKTIPRSTVRCVNFSHEYADAAILSLARKVVELLARIEELTEEMESMVEKGWRGLLTILDEVYPASIFGGKDDDWEDATRDLGPRLTTLAHHLAAEKRRADEAEAALDTLGHDYNALRNLLEQAKADLDIVTTKCADAILAREQAEARSTDWYAKYLTERAARLKAEAALANRDKRIQELVDGGQKTLAKVAELDGMLRWIYTNYGEVLPGYEDAGDLKKWLADLRTRVKKET
jgi:chromosome segregation ATPase